MNPAEASEYQHQTSPILRKPLQLNSEIFESKVSPFFAGMPRDVITAFLLSCNLSPEMRKIGVLFVFGYRTTVSTSTVVGSTKLSAT